jgi:vitamin B12 transporter
MKQGSNAMKQPGKLIEFKALLYLAVGCLLALQGVTVALADETQTATTEAIEEVVVTANKTPTNESEANANITVITRKEIENNHYQNLAEALRTVPGVIVNNYGNGVGFERQNMLRINGSNQIVVLIDGVRANCDSGTSSVFAANSMVALDDIERIEVLKGSASTLYGSDAKGGVINIITQKTDGNKTVLSTAGGSYDTQNYDFNNQGQVGNFKWAVSVQQDRSGDYSDGHGVEVPSDLDATTTKIKLSQNLNERSDISLSYQKYDADYMFSGCLSDSGIKYGTTANSDFNVTYNYRLSDRAQNQLVFYDRKKDTDYDTQYNPWLMDLETIGFQNQLTWYTGDNHTLVSGFDIYRDKVINYDDGYDVYTGKEITNKAVYLQDIWDLTTQARLTAGLRFDDHSLYGGHTTPSINLGYKFTENTSYYMAYSEYFVSPNHYQLYSPYGSTTLEPETGYTLEAGFNHSFNQTCDMAFHVFKRNSEDVISFNSSTWKYLNVDEQHAHGWDLQFNKKIATALGASVGYTHTTIDAASGVRENSNGLIPKGLWNVALNFVQPKYNCSLQGQGIIDRPGETSGAFPDDSYWVWNLAGNANIAKNMIIFAKVNNLLDKYYAEVSNVAYYPYTTGDWYLSPGRNFVAGVKYQF